MLVRLNQILIRLVHRGPTLNEILQKLSNAQYLSLIDVSSGYHNLKLDKRSSYLTTFAANLADTDTRDCHLEQYPKEICSKEK